jgi:ABC-type nitrate/sulfonate/bicarbonate transport system permease component
MNRILILAGTVALALGLWQALVVLASLPPFILPRAWPRPSGAAARSSPNMV